MPTKPKTRASGMWTEARYHAFIVGILRRGHLRSWGPQHKVRKRSNVSYGKYRCAGFGRGHHSVAATAKVGNKRVNNIFVDHVAPVVDPAKGFEGWTTFIARLFVEEEGYQVLCKACHDAKTLAERALR